MLQQAAGRRVLFIILIHLRQRRHLAMNQKRIPPVSSMDYLLYEDGHLIVDGVPALALAERFGTPLYVYSKARIEQRFKHLLESLQVAPNQLLGQWKQLL